MKLLDKNYKKYLSGMDIIGEIAIIKIKSEFLSEKIKISDLIIKWFPTFVFTLSNPTLNLAFENKETYNKGNFSLS